MVLRYLGKLALADFAAGMAEAVYQDYMHQARNWQSVRAWAVAGSFAAAMAF
jgi:hypothetical protein